MQRSRFPIGASASGPKKTGGRRLTGSHKTKLTPSWIRYPPEAMRALRGRRRRSFLMLRRSSLLVRNTNKGPGCASALRVRYAAPTKALGCASALRVRYAAPTKALDVVPHFVQADAQISDHKSAHPKRGSRTTHTYPAEVVVEYGCRFFDGLVFDARQVVGVEGQYRIVVFLIGKRIAADDLVFEIRISNKQVIGMHFLVCQEQPLEFPSLALGA